MPPPTATNSIMPRASPPPSSPRASSPTLSPNPGKEPTRRVDDGDVGTSDSGKNPLSPLSPLSAASQGRLLPPPRQFLRIMGLPTPETTAQGVDTVVVHAAQQDDDTERLRARTERPLSPGTAAAHLIDMLDAESEDPFTLELYGDLMRSCAQQGKDFILARVTTADPADHDRFYNSYYVAHHINKVLFRTQPEEGLLHRMRAKNPLNNMTIVGDVHYYRVTAKAYFAAHERYALQVNLQSGSSTTINNAASAGEIAVSPKSLKVTTTSRPDATNLAADIDRLPFSPPPQSVATVPSLRDVPAPSSKAMTLAERIRRALTNDTSFSDSEPSSKILHIAIREPDAHYERHPTSSSSAPARRQNRRPSADDIFEFVAKSCPTSITDKDDGGLGSQRGRERGDKSRATRSSSSRAASLSRVNKPPLEKPLSATSSTRPYSGWLPFFATRSESSSVPISRKKRKSLGNQQQRQQQQQQQQQQHRPYDTKSELSVNLSPATLASRAYSFDRLRLHSASYRNNFSSGPTMTVDEWIDLKCGLGSYGAAAAAAAAAGGIDDDKSAYITSPSGILSPDSGRSSARFEEASRARRRIVEGGFSTNSNTNEENEAIGGAARIVQAPTAASLEVQAQEITPLPRGAAPRIIYEAEFYATDDDFLMKSSVRAYFKEQALEASDSLLFTIPSAATAALPEVMEPHPALPGYLYTNERNGTGSGITGDGDDEGGGFERRGALRRWLANHKGTLKIAALVYVIGGAVLISLFVPEAFVLPSAFIMIFVLCLGFIFFVELKF